MNYRKLASWQEAESIIPVGGKCFLDPRGERWVTWQDGGWRGPGKYDGFLYSQQMEAYGATPYEATEKEVPISAAEAAARMVDGLPVELNSKSNPPDLGWIRPTPGRHIETIGQFNWRIPAAQPEEDIYQIAVPKGTKLEGGIWVASRTPESTPIPAHVITQEVK